MQQSPRFNNNIFDSLEHEFNAGKEPLTNDLADRYKHIDLICTPPKNKSKRRITAEYKKEIFIVISIDHLI